MAYINNKGLFEECEQQSLRCEETPSRDWLWNTLLVLGTLLVMAGLLYAMYCYPPHRYAYAIRVPDGDGQRTYRTDTIYHLPDGGITIDDGTEIHGSFTINETP